MRRSTYALLVPGLCLLGLFAKAVTAEPRIGSQRIEVAGLHGPERVVAVWPEPHDERAKLPMVIAFHGMAESALGPERGYAAWLERYGLDRAYAALAGSALEASSFGGLVRAAELAALNAELARRPFRGVITVGVYTPDLLRASAVEIDRYAAWVAKSLVPELQRALPFARDTSEGVGVDGVSLGGMVALEVGLRFPDVFTSVGAIQPAVRGREAELAELAARAERHKTLHVRLLSSEHDPLLPVTQALSAELRKRRVAHTLAVYPGGHNYAFNRGPGALSLLGFHDRALREP